MQVTSREARQALYWRSVHPIHRHTGHAPSRPGTSPGPRTAEAGVSTPRERGKLSVSPTVPSLPALLPRGPPGEEPALGGFQRAEGTGGSPDPPGKGCSLMLAFPFLPAWVVNPGSREQVQGPQAWAGWMGHTVGSGSASAIAQARRGPRGQGGEGARLQRAGACESQRGPRQADVGAAGWGLGSQEEGTGIAAAAWPIPGEAS